MAEMSIKKAIKSLDAAIFEMDCLWTSISYAQIPELEGSLFPMQRAGELRAALKIMRGVRHFLDYRERAWKRKQARREA